MFRTRVMLVGLALAVFAAPTASAATLEPIGTFTEPMFITSEPNDPDRLLVVERRGSSNDAARKSRALTSTSATSSPRMENAECPRSPSLL
jgi:hypothetical protein